MAGIPDAMTLLPGMIIESVLNGIWQGVVLAGLTWLLLRAIPRNPGVRCAAWFACLVAIFCLPLAHLATRVWPAVAGERPALRTVPAVMPYASLPSPEMRLSEAHSRPAISLPAGAARMLILGWAMISLLLGVRLALSYRNVTRLKRRARPLDDPDTGVWARRIASCHTRRRFEVRTSGEIRLPMLAGLTRPAILFPGSLLPLLSSEEKRRICLHELAHIRRCDDWANLFQRTAEAIMFFHPALSWVGKRLCLERELACDDWVVSVSGAERPYAACLVRLAELVSHRSHPFPALGSASDRKQIRRRVEMLLNPKRNDKPVWSRAVFAAVIVACLAAATTAARLNPVIAVEDPAVPAAASTVRPGPTSPPELSVPPVAPAPPAAPQAPSAEAKKPAQAAGQTRNAVERIQISQEEIRKLTEEIQKEVEVNLQAKTAEIQKLAEQIQEKVQQSIQPQVREITELARKLAQAETSSPRNEELIRKLQDDIEQHEAQINRVSDQEVKGLEERIHQLEESIKPSEEQIHKLEAKIHEIEKQMKGQVRNQGEESPPPPPVPPVPAVPPPPPPPPVPPQ